MTERFLPQTPSHTKEVYLDYAAAAPLDPAVHEAMMEAERASFANPSSIHEAGRKARVLVEEARTRIARVVQCQPSEVIFTSGGTESCNLAVRGTALAARRARKGSHVVVSAVEHHAVLEAARALERDGFSLTIVSLDIHGRIDPKQVAAALQKDTVLVSVMYANNETGAIQPVRQIGQLCKERGIPFHADACASAVLLPIDINRLQADLLSFSGSKLYGPKGIGALICRRTVSLEPVIVGGGQEHGRRAGTLPTQLIVGLATALETCVERQEKENARLASLKNHFVKRLLADVPGAHVNGSADDALASIVNVSFEGVSGEAVVLYLSASHVYTATGAACTSEKTDPSHVLTAMGLSEERARGSVRFSLGLQTMQEDLDYTVSLLPGILKTLRNV